LRQSSSRLAAGALLLLLLGACKGGFAGRPSRSTPVILISIDTLRSDHLPAYGYKGVATPNIDALRADSILYERAYSNCPLTLPSHTSMMTGLLPADHGVRDNVGFRLHETIPSLPQLLKANGYSTGGAVSTFVLRRETGFSRGFDFFDDEVEPIAEQKIIGRVQRDGRETLAAARAWLDQQSGKPFFFFLHLYEPHTPYTPPEPYFSRYANHYDGEVAYADAIVGELISDLKQKRVYDDALIILLSDHGEGLNEHGEEEHGIFLYREALQVPLLLKLPRSRKHGASVTTPVDLVDVYTTILEQTATPLPDNKSTGRSLLSVLDDSAPRRPIYAETFYPRFHFGWSDLHSLIDGNDHYIRGPIPELFDLAADPGEKKNVLQENRRAYLRLRTAIEPFIRQASAPANIDPEEARKLAALGYVGSTVSTRPGAELPDPKTTLGVFHDIRQAFTWFRDGEHARALALTNKLLEENGQITDLWDLKSKILTKLGRERESIEAAKEGLRRVPASVALLFDIANLALGMGDLDDAQQHAELALKMEPGEAHEILARVWSARGDMKRAEEEAKLALQTSHDPVNALMMLAELEKKRNNMDAALSYLDRAAERVRKKRPPRLAGLHFSRGDILARQGRDADAEREFRQEIASFPAVPDAYASLVILLATQRRLDEATKLIYDLIAASTDPRGYVVAAETLKAIGDDRGAMYWANQGIQKFPGDANLRRLPSRLQAASTVLRDAGVRR